MHHSQDVVDKYLWIGDTGASCHFINSDKGMFNIKRIHHAIGIGDSKTAVAVKEGSVTIMVHQRNGNKSIVTLHGCKYLPGLSNNMFSITQAISKGWRLSNKGNYIVLEQKNGKIVFDTPDRSIHGILGMTPIIDKAMDMKALRTQLLIMAHSENFENNSLTPNPTQHLPISYQVGKINGVVTKPIKNKIGNIYAFATKPIKNKIGNTNELHLTQ
jgi:hypothetical protein